MAALVPLSTFLGSFKTYNSSDLVGDDGGGRRGGGGPGRRGEMGGGMKSAPVSCIEPLNNCFDLGGATKSGPIFIELP